jgi:hypothetical protein
MRLAIVILAATLPLAASASSIKPTRAAPTLPFNGSWIDCETYQGAEICTYKVLAQRGSRVCGLWHEWATNADYDGRLIATAQGSTAKIDKICGRQGSETRTECQSDKSAPATWEATNRTLFLCRGALYEARPGEAASCKGVNTASGLSKARGRPAQSPDPSELDWLTACVSGADAR